jgi:PIN domain
MTDSSDQLETGEVFIDTEVFVREKFNWNSKSLVRLKELVKFGQLRILTTGITKNEVKSRIREAIAHAATAVKKHEITLEQLGLSDAHEKTCNPDAATNLASLFEEFLTEVRAVEVPLHADLDNLCKDYFEQKPPFSAKKKVEFPDAIVIASLRERSSKTGRKIYVVSADPDLKECCGEGGNLIHAEAIAGVISRATVTKQLHDQLLSFLANSDDLKNRLQSKVRGTAVSVVRLSSYADGGEIEGTGSVTDAMDVSITHMDVLSQHENQFTCEVEFKTHLVLNLDFEIGSRMTNSSFEASRSFGEMDTTHRYFQAEVVVRFDPKSPADAEIESIYCDPTVLIDVNEVDWLRRLK